MILVVCLACLAVLFGRGMLARWRIFSASRSCDSSSARENVRLRSEISLLKEGICARGDSGEYVKALVYAEYPWGLGGKLVIDRGSEEGIRQGMPVFTEEMLLLGKVSETKRHMSEVQTIFDGSWKSSVVLGGGSTKAVMNGGMPPRVKMVPREADVREGMSVVNSDANYPLHQVIGETGKFTNSGDVWKEAPVSVPYSVHNLTAVLIQIDFP